MNELAQLFKAKQEEEVRIPVPPKMPKPPRKRGRAISACPERSRESPPFPSRARPSRPGIFLSAAERHDDYRHKRLHTEQSHRARQIFRKDRDQHARDGQITQGYPLKRAAPSQNACCFIKEQMNKAGTRARL
jgi:hypothetical protein